MLSSKLSALQFSASKLPNIQVVRNKTKVMVPLSKGPPRTHMRRLFEAVTQPVLPDSDQFVQQKPAALRCKRPAIDAENTRKIMELSPREMALKKHLRKHLLEATVIIVCHEHPTDTRLQHYDLMELSANGIALARMLPAKIIRSVVRDSTLEGLASFFDDDTQLLTSLLYTKRYIETEDDGRDDVTSGRIRDRNYLPLAMRFANRINWLVPLVVVYEDRLLTVSDAERVVSMLKNPLQVRAETSALLSSPMMEVGRLLTDHSLSFSTSLQSRIDQLTTGDEKKPATNDG